MNKRPRCYPMATRSLVVLAAALVLIANAQPARSQTSRTNIRSVTAGPPSRNNPSEAKARGDKTNKKIPAPNLAKEPTLYVVGYAHLDTEWRWEYPQVISEYLTKTMRNNFALFEKYPHYIFNFTGANRY